MLAYRLLDNLEAESADGQRWESLVRENPASGVMQSLHWAKFKQHQGFQTVHLGIYEQQRLIGGMIAYAANHQGPRLLVAPEGPVLPWHDPEVARAGLKTLLAAIEAEPELRALSLRIEPHLEPPRPRLFRSFGRAPIDLLPVETLYLDLAPEPEAILQQMRPKGRYNIRLAARHGVTVREDSSPEAAQLFYTVMDEAGQRDDFFVEPPSFFADLASTLCPPKIARFLFAEYQGEVLGAILLITYGTRATYLYGGVTNRRRQVMGGYALQWHAMLAARAAGCGVYDFYGYEPHGAPDHLYAGFSRFKRQFGGQPKRFIGAHDYMFLDNLADAVVQATREITDGLPKDNV